MDFFLINMKEIESGPDKGQFVLFPDFIVGRSQDLMVRGKSFYAVWDEEAGMWSTDEYDVQRLVDAALDRKAAELERSTGTPYKVKHLRYSSNNGWAGFRRFLQNISDNSHDLDGHLVFSNTEIKKTDYVSKRLPYPLVDSPCPAWDELVGTLYNSDERQKIEWILGAIVTGDSQKIQKFGVFYGPPASGKSTILNIVSKMFEGYTTTFDAKALGSSSAQFATEVFKGNPLVGIQHDGDLSKIEDNARLNSIVSHEDMTMNEKFKPGYSSKIKAFLLMGTNQPVKISDAKSGIIRRLIDIHPTGVMIPRKHYDTLLAQIEFEMGAIANHCREVYLSMGKNYYSNYRPLEMMLQTDIFFNFVEANFDIFSSGEGVTLKHAYGLYKEFCNDTGIDRQLPQYKVREELRNYFDHFQDRATVDGVVMRSYYSGFNGNKFKAPSNNDITFSLVLDETESLFDAEYAFQPAQYANDKEWPKRKWEFVKSTLESIDTSLLHFVKVPEHHIVIDFDLRDETGEKSLEMNLAAASVWPPTYAELSKGGAGVHLHYNYEGNVDELAPAYSEGIEVKTLLGDASLRRRLTRCNNIPVATFAGKLPLKEKKMLSQQTMAGEKTVREMITKNLRKEYHPSTKSSIDFIKKILDDAYEDGMSYDVENMRARITAFANNSQHQPLECLRTVQQMKWKSRDMENEEPRPEDHPALFQIADERLVFFDVEVYPNLFVICWKYEDDEYVSTMINPTAQEVAALFNYKLVGFYNRRYDNHILYAASLGYSVTDLYKLSQKIVNNVANAMFGEAYNLSYGDVWDIASIKQTLKKWMVDLGIHHMEMDIPWDEPVKDEDIPRIVEYCKNDVRATEATKKAREGDWTAREILAELSGLSINDTGNRHAGRIIFGQDRNPSASFNYEDLSRKFPGYEFDHGKSIYRGETVGEGGYVYAEPGMYTNVALLDVASMHPTSIMQLNLFGNEYTHRFGELLETRLAIKGKDYDAARKMLGGRLVPFLQDVEGAKALSDALKIVINSVYGLTSAKFDNQFRDKRNKDNIVAKRGALFMIDLKHAVQEQGFTVAHIKTDSIKIPDATPEIIDFVKQFGLQYGYNFEHEATYDRFCLTNDAVYVAREGGKWKAVGAQFQHPYVYKELFSHEEIEWDDLCETKQVQKGVMYLDFDAVQKPMFQYSGRVHVGRIGRFIPVTAETGGALLLRVLDGKDYAVAGTKGYFWMEAEMATHQFEEPKIEIDMGYFEGLVDKAKAAINKFGNFDEFIS